MGVTFPLSNWLLREGGSSIEEVDSEGASSRFSVADGRWFEH